jgi:uncharacterized 2Fe-2S/4Fe-4S cluster protein (DUF4445 family)
LERLRQGGFHLRADCGGEGSCGRCRVRYLSPAPIPDEDETDLFTTLEIAAGWRLACRHVDEVAEVEINADWEPIFQLESSGSIPSEAVLGLAVDIGTTGLVVALVDKSTGKILLTARGYNPQRAWGADVMTRLVSARDPAALNLLQQAVLNSIQGAYATLQAESPPFLWGGGGNRIPSLAVGNTAMIHLAAGVPETTLSVFPFHSPLEERGSSYVSTEGMSLQLAGPVSGFVGSDLLAVLRALNLHSASPLLNKEAQGGGGDFKPPTLIMDLGTNSEIALWDGEGYWVTSCAAGPAFEGGGISCGSPAGPSVAVDVQKDEGNWKFSPEGLCVGLCGSALIALLAQLIRSGEMDHSGKLVRSRTIVLQDDPPLKLTQKDVRSLQLAKGAIHTGITVLARRAGLTLDAIRRIVVTGAFARSLKADDLKEIGLIPFVAPQVTFMNDGALQGAALALADEEEPFSSIRPLIQVVNLVDEPDFQDLFVAGVELKPMESPNSPE